MARNKGKGKIHPKVLEIKKSQQYKPLNTVLRGDNNMSLYPPTPVDVNGLSLQRKDPCFDLVVLHCSSPHEPVSMLPPGAAIPSGETPVKVYSRKKKRKRAGNTSEVSGRSNKRKRIGYNPFMRRKIKTLGESVNPIPFSPKKKLDLEAHRCLLTNLGLWDFLHVDFSKVIMPGLIEEIVANYNPKRPLNRVSFVNGYPMKVSQSVMASALRLRTKRKLPDQSDSSVVLVVSEEEASFVEEVIWNYMVLQGSCSHIPEEVMRVVRLVRERKLEQVDWAGLIWFMMEKELLKGMDLRHCYYASHMQSLVQHLSPWLINDGYDDTRCLEMGSAARSEGHVARFLEMGSAARSEGHAAKNQLMLLDGNENNDLNNGLLLENSSVNAVEAERIEVMGALNTMDNALLSSCTTVKKNPLVEGHSSSKLETLGGQNEVPVIVVEEDNMVIEDEIHIVHAEQDLEEGNHQYKDLMTRLFDEVENEESKGTVNKGVCDAKAENQQMEDDGMDTQRDNLSWHAMDENNDPHSVDTSFQQVGFVIMQDKGSTESMSDFVAKENNVSTQVPSMDHNIGEQICVPAEDATDMEQVRTDLILGREEKHVEESRQQLVNDVCDTNVGASLEKKEVSMMAANDADQHSSETANQQLVLGGEDPISDVVITENNISSTEHVRVSDTNVAMELEDKDKGDVLELEYSHRIYDGNACNNVQPIDLDPCAQEVDCWFSNFKPVPNIQPRPSYEEIIKDLKAKLAQQIRVNESYDIQLQVKHQMMNREITRYAKQLHLADNLVEDYKRMSKARDKLFAEHMKKCQQPVEEALYMDHPDLNGKMITVAEWKKLIQEQRDEEIRNRILSMLNDFQDGLTVGLQGYFHKLDTLCHRVSVCGDSVNKLKADVSRS